jgi:hypothetical protein
MKATNDRLESFGIYKIARQLFDDFWADAEILGKDYRGRELVKQQIRSLDSICANIEEGYGRGFGRVHFTLGASFAGRINSLQPQRETDLRRFPPSRRRATWGRGSRKFICPCPICPKTEMHPFGKELLQHLKIARGEARESKGRFERCRHLLPPDLISSRILTLDHIIGGLTRTINTIEQRNKSNS